MQGETVPSNSHTVGPRQGPQAQEASAPGGAGGPPGRKPQCNAVPVTHTSGSCSPAEEARRKQSFPVRFQFFLEYFLCVPRGSKFFPVSLPRIKSPPEEIKSIFSHASINAQVGFKSFYFNMHFLLQVQRGGSMEGWAGPADLHRKGQKHPVAPQLHTGDKHSHST